MNLKVSKNNQPVPKEALNCGDLLELTMPDHNVVPIKVELTSNEPSRATAYAPNRQFGCLLRVDPATNLWFGGGLFAGQPQPTIVMHHVHQPNQTQGQPQPAA